MDQYYLCFKLLSDGSFGRGDGLAGEVDSEIQFDELGCPYLGGRTLKGLLVNECADILSALSTNKKEKWESSARRLFGQAGQLSDINSLLKIDHAKLPTDLRDALLNDLQTLQGEAQNEEEAIKIAEKFQLNTLRLLTTIRTQTAIDDDGVAKQHSLRSKRVVIRETPFESLIYYLGQNDVNKKEDLALLSACVASFRRAGTNRTRGLGKISAWLEDDRHQKMPELINPFLEGVI